MAKAENLKVTFNADKLSTDGGSAIPDAFVEDLMQRLTTLSKSKIFGSTISTRPFTGLRPILEADKWKFGTIHRNKVSDERVMVVGYRKVTGLAEGMEPEDTAYDWFEFWEPET